MAFESVVIRSVTTTVPAPPVDGSYREDLVPGDLVSLSLLDLVTGLPPIASSYKWQMVGRPERAVGGGGGPLPITMATTNTTTFTVDADAGAVLRDGTYNVACILNEGLPTERRISVALVRDSGLTIPDLVGVRTLRRPGGFESLEDTQDPDFLQGWARAMNRWLEYIIGLSAPVTSSSILQELLTNDSGVTAAIGKVVRTKGNSTFDLARADDATLYGASINPINVVGVVGAAAILNAASGLVITHGVAPIQFINGLTGIAAGQSVWLAEDNGGTWRGMATTSPPDGSMLAPIGILEDVTGYVAANPAGTLLPVKLQIPATQVTASREVGRNEVTVNATPTTIMALTLRDGCTYVLDLSVAATSADQTKAGGWREAVTVKVDMGTASFVGGTSVLHLGMVGGLALTLTAGSFGAFAIVATGIAATTVRWTAHAKLTAAKRLAPAAAMSSPSGGAGAGGGSGSGGGASPGNPPV